MNHQLTYRTNTLVRPAARPTSPAIDPAPTSTPPGGGRRRWFVGVAVGAAVVAGVAGVAGWSAWSSPDVAPVPVSPPAVGVAVDSGPNVDLGPDFTCQRSPVAPNCSISSTATPVASPGERVDGPNADLAPDPTGNAHS